MMAFFAFLSFLLCFVCCHFFSVLFVVVSFSVEVPSRDSAAQVRPIGIFADARVVPLSTSLSAGIDGEIL